MKKKMYNTVQQRPDKIRWPHPLAFQSTCCTDKTGSWGQSHDSEQLFPSPPPLHQGVECCAEHQEGGGSDLQRLGHCYSLTTRPWAGEWLGQGRLNEGKTVGKEGVLGSAAVTHVHSSAPLKSLNPISPDERFQPPIHGPPAYYLVSLLGRHGSSPHPALPPHVTETSTAEGCWEKLRRRGRKGATIPPQPLRGIPPYAWALSVPRRQGRVLQENFGGAPGCGSGEDSMESYRPLTDQESWYQGDHHQGPDSVGSFYPYWDHQEYYGEHDRSERQTDTSLRLEHTHVSF
ncbi:hypothetical protein P4O66_018302 [Electrophorus voltai]|uniref:Uncharacterized protein n=1 Tax=Electrophorus voltai TaxID=2609070 RepID=A0AAD9DM50_9TELE|nr:hypothetical protein P4O66_018302 [Electrophorus voltai]